MGKLRKGLRKPYEFDVADKDSRCGNESDRQPNISHVNLEGGWTENAGVH